MSEQPKPKPQAPKTPQRPAASPTTSQKSGVKPLKTKKRK